MRLLHLWVTASFRRLFILGTSNEVVSLNSACNADLENVISFVDNIVLSFGRKVSREISTAIMVVFSDMLMFDLTPLVVYEALDRWLQAINSSKDFISDDAVPLMCRMLCLMTNCKDKATSDKKIFIERSIISVLSSLADTNSTQEKCVTLLTKSRLNIKASVSTLSIINKISVDKENNALRNIIKDDERFVSLLSQLQTV